MAESDVCDRHPAGSQSHTSDSASSYCMAMSPRLIRRRIKSVTGTRKITKAMELVSAAKMRKAVSSVLATRPYAEAAWGALRELAKVTDPTSHPLLRVHSDAQKKTLVILFSSDRGLCGGFNSQLLRQFMAFSGKKQGQIDVVAVGKKGQDGLRRRNVSIVGAFADLGNVPKLTDIRPIADLAITDFVAAKYDAVWLAFTNFRSALTQIPTIRQLLPLTTIDGFGDVEELRGLTPNGSDPVKNVEFLFEPSPQAVLDTMLPRLVEAQIYQALLDSTASEHSARMMAMRSATDAASEMIEDLTLTYNQARQAGITREIAEISSGKAALEK